MTTLPLYGNGNPIPAPTLSTTERVSISGAAAACAAQTTTSVVRVVSDTDCFILFGGGPVATVSKGALLPAKTAEYFTLRAGQKISFITASGSGYAYVTQVL